MVVVRNAAKKSPESGSKGLSTNNMDRIALRFGLDVVAAIEQVRRLLKINWTKLRSDLGWIWSGRLNKTAGIIVLCRGFCD